MHASLHRVKKITLGEIEPLRDGGAAKGPILSYVLHIKIEYDEGARLELVCHADEPNDLYLAGYLNGQTHE